jgi:hypothetical protein
VLEPEHGIAAIGSGGNYALAAARGMLDSDKDAEDHRARSHGDRRRYLRLHQRQPDGGADRRMTGITRDDVRAAVASGTLSEAQAASLIVLSEERAGVRTHLTGLDEPFELFKGFNEIFIVVGLTILYLGFAGVTGLTLFGTTKRLHPRRGLFRDRHGRVIVLLARYFTLKRRMVAPSIALSVMFGYRRGQFGISFSAMLDLKARRP